MTKRVYSTVLLLLFAMNSAFSQEPITDNNLGANYVFQSDITGEQQQLQVYLPEGYRENTTTKYPVMYLLDGQNWFSTAVSMHKVFTGSETDYKSMPDFIVVGVTTNWEKRREFFGTANKKDAIRFMEKEVIAFIDKTFRTTEERMLFGWQFAGGFVMNALAHKPELFSGYLAATPVFYDPEGIDKLLSDQNDLNKFLYIAGTKEEADTWVHPTIDILKNKAPKSFNWNYKEIAAFGAFGHRVSPIETISYGLRAYFSDYPYLEFKNVSDFNKKGGLNYVNKFYKKRAEKYGASEEMSFWEMYVLVRLSIRENHYPTFNLLMSEFKANDFVENLSNWQLFTCADFYSNHNEQDKTIELYNVIIKKSPENARAFNGLGNAYMKKGEPKKATQFYEKAVVFAEKSNDANLNNYKEALLKAKS